MNSAIFWRLVWKEYRQQRALWAAIAVAGLILQLAVLIYCSLNGVADFSNGLFTVALSVPVLYSLGCGATLFAGEYEAETFPFQQSLPVAAGRVFFAKLVFGVVSALLLFPVLWLLALAMTSWELPDEAWHLQLWGGGLVSAIEVLIWAALSSLLLRRVLPAAIVGGVAAVLLGYGSLVLMVAFRHFFEHPANEYFGTMPARSCFALLALAVAIKFGRQWFDEHATRWRAPATQSTRPKVTTQRPAIPATGFTVFMRLVWHEWRQANLTMLWCVLGYLILGTWMAASQADGTAFLGLLSVLATIFGANTFAADQRQGQFKFFTEHGVRPRLVWFSRQFVWGCVLAMIAAAAFLQFSTSALAPHGLYLAGSLLGLAIIVFASGQLCSILIRSGIVALFTAALCSALLVFWIGFMQQLGVPVFLCALPFPFIFFGASWLYAPTWIQQRQTWRVRAVTAATILLPLLGVVAATAAYRVYEIPAVTLSFNAAVPEPDKTPAAQATAAMYQEADRLLRRRLTSDPSNHSTVISSRDDEWQKGIELFVAASQRPTCRFPQWHDQGAASVFDGAQLTRAILAEAEARTELGDFQGAAELHVGLLQLAANFYDQNSISYGLLVEQSLFAVLPEWANQEPLTAAQIQQSLLKLQTWCVLNQPDWEASIIEHRRDVQRFIAMDDEMMSSYYRMGATERNAIKAVGTLLPWERWRMSRLLDVCTEAEIQGMRDIRARAERLPPHALRTLQWDVRLDVGRGKQRLVRSTQVEAWLGTTRWLQVTSALTAPAYVTLDRQSKVRRNAVQQQLALLAWRKAHGELPDSLPRLVGDPLETLPLDPYTNQPFLYFPNGVEEEIWETDEAAMGGTHDATEGMGMMAMGGEGMAPMKSRLVRSEPFLWSPGELLRYNPRTRRGPAGSARPSDFRDRNGKPLTDTDLLSQGLRYPIPPVKEQPSVDSDALPNE